MAKFLKEGNPLPKRPEGLKGSSGFFFSGKVKRFLKSRVTADNSNSARLCWTILQGIKRGTAQVPYVYVKEALLKHRQAMRDESHDKERKEATDSWVMQKDFEEKAWKLTERFKAKFQLYEASTSASYESNRKKGGQRGYLISNLAPFGSQWDQIEADALAVKAENDGKVVSGNRIASKEATLTKMKELAPGVVEEVNREFTLPNFDDLIRLSGALPTPGEVMPPLEVYSRKFKQFITGYNVLQTNPSARTSPDYLTTLVKTRNSKLLVRYEMLSEMLDWQDKLEEWKEARAEIAMKQGPSFGRLNHNGFPTSKPNPKIRQKIKELGKEPKRPFSEEFYSAATLASEERFFFESPIGKEFRYVFSLDEGVDDYKPNGRYLSPLALYQSRNPDDRLKMDAHVLPRVTVKAVLEPLKVRLITVGEAVPYYTSKFFQKAMFKHLRRFPQFNLIGSPLTTVHLDEMRKRRDKLDPQGRIFKFWVSGDYSAATDKIKSLYTQHAFEAFLSRTKLSDPVKTLLRSVLYAQIVEYPGGIPTVVQENGQLMGSPLSFPILCMVNLIAYWISMEEYFGYEIEMEDLPCLVNGDDILFPSNSEHYKIWFGKITEVGFELSQGKNYCSKKYLTVNSLLFKDDGSKFVKIEYFNVGLLTGQSKLNSERAKKELTPVWANYNTVMAGAVNKARAHRRFVHYNREVIDAVSNKGEFSLFAHPLQGGLGFKHYEGVDLYFTNFQRKLASFLRREVLKPFSGRDISTARAWKGIVRKNVRKSEPNIRSYKEIRPLLGEGPLNHFEYVFENSSATEAPLSYMYDTETPPFEVKGIRPRMMASFRRAKGLPVLTDEEVMNFPVRFIGIEKFKAQYPESISLGAAGEPSSGPIQLEDYLDDDPDPLWDTPVLDPLHREYFWTNLHYVSWFDGSLSAVYELFDSEVESN
nr:MAG: RNA-dependent RNA polymerase [Riboviria sp.]